MIPHMNSIKELLWSLWVNPSRTLIVDPTLFGLGLLGRGFYTKGARVLVLVSALGPSLPTHKYKEGLSGHLPVRVFVLR